ncbi:MAG: LamG domain-containing protein, partial [Gammaproteobacteria bacterium]|nr:LamG domain-containing protein [Gammaproteobacteria bacterium]
YHSPNANSYYLRLNRDAPYNKLEFGGQNWVTSLSTLNTDQWYFVVGMRDSGIGKIYINGKLDNSSAVSISSSADSLYIGMDYKPDARYFDGAMDNVMIFNRTLSEADIKTMYDSGLGQ